MANAFLAASVLLAAQTSIIANSIAKWNGRAWSALGSGIDGGVSVLAVSGSDLYAEGEFTTAGGKVSGYATRAVPPDASVHSSGTCSWPAPQARSLRRQYSLLAIGWQAQASSWNTRPPWPTPASWTTGVARVTDNTTNKSVSIRATDSQKFLRLRKP